MFQPWCAHRPLRRVVTWSHKRDEFYFKRYLCLGKPGSCPLVWKKGGQEHTHWPWLSKPLLRPSPLLLINCLQFGRNWKGSVSPLRESWEGICTLLVIKVDFLMKSESLLVLRYPRCTKGRLWQLCFVWSIFMCLFIYFINWSLRVFMKILHTETRKKKKEKRKSKTFVPFQISLLQKC